MATIKGSPEYIEYAGGARARIPDSTARTSKRQWEAAVREWLQELRGMADAAGPTHTDEKDDGEDTININNMSFCAAPC